MLTRDFIVSFLENPDDYKDTFYEESIMEDEAIAEVFGDSYPAFMSIQRPNETESQKEYRRAYFEQVGNPVKGFLGQIERQVEKIFSSEEFKYIFSDKSSLGTESFRNYATNGYYNGNDFISSFASSIKRASLVSPNAVLSVIPNEDTDSNYPDSYFLISPSANVIQYKANELCIVQSQLETEVVDVDGNFVRYGRIYYFFDKRRYCVAKEVSVNEDGSTKWSMNLSGDSLRLHGSDFLPCKKIGKEVKEFTEDGYELRTSDISSCLVFLRNAIMDYQDLKVEHNFHIASQEWVLGTVRCTDCNGTGKVRGDGRSKGCETCGGGGKLPSYSGSGMDKMVVPMGFNELGGSDKLPSSFGGFIARPETGAKIFSKSFEANMTLALRPFGLEHLLDQPYNQSGSAKSYDMQEGHAFIMSMSDHLGGLLNMTSNAIINARYKKLPTEKIANEKPILITPKTFNLSTVGKVFEKIRDAGQYGFGDSVIMLYKKQLVAMESGVNSEDMKILETKEAIDPMPTANFNQKSISRASLSDIRYILTMNIDWIIRRAMRDNENFLGLNMSDREDICMAIAREILAETQDNLDNQIVIRPNTNVIGEDQTS